MSNKQSSGFSYGDAVTILSPLDLKPLAHGTIERETLKCGNVLVRTNIPQCIATMDIEIPIKLIVMQVSE